MSSRQFEHVVRRPLSFRRRAKVQGSGERKAPRGSDVRHPNPGIPSLGDRPIWKVRIDLPAVLLLAWIVWFGSLYVAMVIRTKAPGLLGRIVAAAR